MRRLCFLAVVTLAACTFPDVTISDKPIDSSVGDVGGNDAKVDATETGEVGDASDAEVEEFDTALPDTAPEDVFVPPTDAPPDFGADAKACDIDGDGYQPIGGTCSPPAGKADCDDLNPSANPGIPAGTYYHVTPPATLKPAGDWNCDGSVEKQYTKLAAAPVANPCPGLSTGCVERSGVDAVPDCGKPLNIIVCAVDGLLGCKESTRTAATQGCR